MSGADQFQRDGTAFAGMAVWTRRYAVDEAGAWVAGSLRRIRTALRDQGWIVRAIPDGVRRGRVTLLDSFDWRLTQRGAAILRDENGAWWYLPIAAANDPLDPGRLEARLSQGRPAEPDRPEMVPVEPTDQVAPRAILRYGSCSWEERLFTVGDENGKTIALLQDTRCTRPVDGALRRGALELLRIVPLRGFRRYLPDLAGRSVDAGEEIASFLAEPSGRRPLDYETSLNLPLRGDHTVAEVHRIVLDHLLAVCAINLDGILRRIDPEFLHDFRVSLRRLRSYLRAVPHRSDPAVEQELRRFWDAGGRPRDLDVFLLREDHYAESAPIAIRQEVLQVFAQLSRRRDRAYEHLVDRLSAGEFVRLREGLGATTPEDPEGSARELAAALHRRAERAFGRSVDRLVRAYHIQGEGVSDDRIHDARIKAKKLRYVTEIFSPLLCGTDSDTRRTVGRMRKLQNLLGAYNDLVVEEKLFLRILDERSGEFERLRAGVAYMLAQVEREKAVARHRVMETLGREAE